MLANRADLDVYVWAQVGKGLAKLKTAQNIAIISHLEKYVHTVTFSKKYARKWGCFQNLPVYQKSVPSTLKVHIYLYHWAVQVLITCTWYLMISLDKFGLGLTAFTLPFGYLT